jgi:magnesium chelatase family protein
MNPCPCGYLGDPKRECSCSPVQIQRYRARVSGPLLDRIDLHVEAPSLSVAELRTDRLGESSAAIRARVQAARTVQQARFAGTRTHSNARMTPAQIRRHCAHTPCSVTCSSRPCTSSRSPPAPTTAS